MQPLLSLRHVAKSFGGARALAEASLDLFGGRVTALIGENGAGKSTLVKILAGYHAPDAGEIVLDGKPVRIDSPRAAEEFGIAVVHQECVVFDNLSVAENLFVSAKHAASRWIDWRGMRARARTVLDSMHCELDPDARVGTLSTAQKHIVQIARALTADARVLILDEPTASLSHAEAEELFRIARDLRDKGCAVLFISHKFEEIYRLADRYSVFRDGVAVGEGDLRDIDRNELIRMMVGREIAQLFPKTSTPTAQERLRVEKLSRVGEFAEVSFEAKAGEILGIYGLVGAGRSELAHALFGLVPFDSGAVIVDGVQVAMNSAADALRAGFAYVPEDRQHQGAILPFSIAQNVALPNLRSLSKRGWFRVQLEHELAADWIARLAIKAQTPAQQLQELSGGNQQKVVIAKWLARKPRILILDEPTRGIDVGAKAAVHAVTSEFAQQGNTVILISSDLPEVLAMSDRIVVMRRGRVRRIFDRTDANSEDILRAATDA